MTDLNQRRSRRSKVAVDRRPQRAPRRRDFVCSRCETTSRRATSTSRAASSTRQCCMISAHTSKASVVDRCPTTRPSKAGAPNFHRMNRNDSRAYVQGCFHQFVFFPVEPGSLRLVQGVRACVPHEEPAQWTAAPKSFWATSPRTDARRAWPSRLPRGGGFLDRHADPVDHHQLTVPIMQMSRKGTDFHTGGLFVQLADGSDLVIDDVAEPGDVVYFNAACPHGVEPIDPDAPLRWTTFAGRWMLLFAVNRLAGNSAIGNAVTLPRKPM